MRKREGSQSREKPLSSKPKVNFRYQSKYNTKRNEEREKKNSKKEFSHFERKGNNNDFISREERNLSQQAQSTRSLKMNQEKLQKSYYKPNLDHITVKRAKQKEVEKEKLQKNSKTLSNNPVLRKPPSLPRKPLSLSQKAKIPEKGEKIDEIEIKLVLVGDKGTGKTAMITSYTTNKFPQQHISTVFDTYIANAGYGEEKVKLHIWDTAGDENYFCFREVSCKDADVVLICFSMVDDRSLQSAIEKWFPQTQEYCPTAEKILVGTKEDLHREYEMDPQTEQKVIPLSKIHSTISGTNIQFMTCSSLNQKGLNEIFTKCIKHVLKQKKKQIFSMQCPLI